MGVLADILARKRERIADLRATGTHARATARFAGDAAAHLRRAPGEPLRLIAEIKPKSPSAGVLSSALSPAARGDIYAAGGVAAISVLTDEDFFGGSFQHLADVASRSPVPVLCKDFVLDPVQLEAAAAAGASMVLLIVRLLDRAMLGALFAEARGLRLEPFVEVTTEAELALALDVGAGIVGVNARDLDTLVMDRDRAARVLAAIPQRCVAVHLSGLRAPSDVRDVAGRVDAALLGEALMRQDDPAPLLHQLIDAAGGPWRAR